MPRFVFEKARRGDANKKPTRNLVADCRRSNSEAAIVSTTAVVLAAAVAFVAACTLEHLNERPDCGVRNETRTFSHI